MHFSEIIFSCADKGESAPCLDGPTFEALCDCTVSTLNINDLIRKLHGGDDIEHIGSLTHLFLIEKVEMI